MKKNVAYTFVLAATLELASAPVSYGQHPAVLANDNSGLGKLEWRTASEILYPDGSVRPTVVASTRRQLEEQLLWFAGHYGGSQEAAAFVEGSQPASRFDPERFCKPWPVIDYAPPEHYGNDLASIILLTDVAVVGTISDVVPGFRGAQPALLNVLSDLVPLRPGSLVPEYFIMPVAQYVVNGQVFCGDPQFNEWLPTLEAGERVVLVGRSSGGAVWTGPALTYDLATVDKQTGRLKWHNRLLGYSPKDRPATLALLRERIDEAVHGRLFEMAAPLQLEQSHSPKRRELSETWWKLHEGNCRITSAKELGAGSWELTQICGFVQRRIVR